MSEGHSYSETAVTFKVSASTLQAWKAQLNETGTLAPKKRKKTWRKIDPDAYQHENAAAFGVRFYAIQKALKRLKITRKKTAIYEEADESFRQSFVDMLNFFPSESLVYVDECGIDLYLYREFAYSPRRQKVVA